MIESVRVEGVDVRGRADDRRMRKKDFQLLKDEEDGQVTEEKRKKDKKNCGSYNVSYKRKEKEENDEADDKIV